LPIFDFRLQISQLQWKWRFQIENQKSKIKNEIMSDLIQPRTLKGFRDYPPELMIPREYLLEQARRVYRSYGFAPIDTPALEYAEILLAKSGESEGDAEVVKQVYRFKDHGDRDVALRFDLTVPFARFAAQYIGQLGTPFKRYHMGPVWRGENTARGRFREFWQCDFDTIGTTANAADIEVVLVIHDLMKALGVEGFQIHVNNRLVLNGLLEELGLAARANPVLRALDKLAKVGPDEVRAEMMDAGPGKAGAGREQADRVLALAQTRGSNAQVLERLRHDFGNNARAAQGIAKLAELVDAALAAGVAEERLCLDVAIARGLDYYTGTIYETFLTDLPGIGSICSGGRYDNLAGRFTRQSLPGVGASLGLDRLLAALEELKLVQKTATPAPVLLLQFDGKRLGDYQKMARALRATGIGVEVFPEAKKLGAQLQYAEKRGFRAALIAGPDEFAHNVWKVKDLAKREESTVTTDAVAAFLENLLARPC
jgi:histidyl-tRNA synthetase